MERESEKCSKKESFSNIKSSISEIIERERQNNGDEEK